MLHFRGSELRSVEHVTRLTRSFCRSLCWSVVLGTHTLKLALIENDIFMSFSYWLGPKTRNNTLVLCNPKHMRQDLLAWKQDFAVAIQILLSLHSIVLGLVSIWVWVSSRTGSLEYMLLRAVGVAHMLPHCASTIATWKRSKWSQIARVPHSLSLHFPFSRVYGYPLFLL